MSGVVILDGGNHGLHKLEEDHQVPGQDADEGKSTHSLSKDTSASKFKCNAQHVFVGTFISFIKDTCGLLVLFLPQQLFL